MLGRGPGAGSSRANAMRGAHGEAGPDVPELRFPSCSAILQAGQTFGVSIGRVLRAQGRRRCASSVVRMAQEKGAEGAGEG